MSDPTGPETPARPSRDEDPAVGGSGRERRALGRTGRRGGGRRGDDDAAVVAPNSGALLADGLTSTGRKGNPVAWTALLVAAVLTVWQAVYALSVQGVSTASQDVYTSVSLFVSLVLGLSAAVLGVVGIAQRRHPRWPALVGLAVGLNVFLVSVFSWIGGLMNTGT
ncbi:hypothetical protein [Georgenia subflava]|uniref:Uncharacterized protein n=1 Tax=Georgenia subflava TaxID=1622177 RepID=A0A6N7EKG8_9MICO|nr:hypothetical protein [Georgenia subflava]MPV37543.1 hypothetical protein [Georgenia subflava]